MKAIVDRIEGDIVVVELEDGMKDYDIGLFPDNIKEGDVVYFREGKFLVDIEKTKSRQEYINKLLDSLFDQ